jgi:hypothetical protein
LIYIRSTNEECYRAFEWGHLFSIQHDKQGRDIWVVEFPDGGTDAWPSWDVEAGYDVRVQIEPPEDSHGNQGIEASGPARGAGPSIPDHPVV